MYPNIAASADGLLLKLLLAQSSGKLFKEG